eukprot:CAMPEP_0170746454 /NCGR_PEP_ID=MMETSP0437-20130122/8818_1 /TAXON_ID=0 /ORGANISM="Sexangularia sp." /LENGTH=315 /DNA_ID=CAMNT_0011085207 /DNA_START=167 /DNA_END=1114 /DNA_ORIENTATION=-
MAVATPVDGETAWWNGMEEWQCFSPISVHVIGFFMMHSTYDFVMTFVSEMSVRYAAHLRVDEVNFLNWNCTSLIMHLWSVVFSYYLWYIDFSMSHAAMQTWTSMFFAYFVIDVMYILKIRMFFKEKILRFLVLHHILTFGVCLLFVTAFLTPQFAGPSGRMSLFPTLWNSSSAVSNALFLYRMFHGVSTVDSELLHVTIAAFVTQRSWRMLVYVVGLSSPHGTWLCKLIMLSPGIFMDVFDSMSQLSAIQLIQRKLREEDEFQTTSQELFKRMLHEQRAEVAHMPRSPTPSPTLVKRLLKQTATSSSPLRLAGDE